MKISDIFDYDSFFRSGDDIKKYVENSDFYHGEDKENIRLHRIFETSKQRTYLVNSGLYIYCVLDDRRESEPEIRWAEPITKFVQDNKLIVPISKENKNANTGIINFGDEHKNWLYTKSLLPDENWEENLVDIFTFKN